MLGLVPAYLLSRFRQGRSQGVEHGCAICVDVSGFTPLVERLGGLGRRGAEILSEGIGALYSRVETAVEEGGGFVSTFGGDSFSVVVPEEGPDAGRKMARRLLELFGEAGRIGEGYGLVARAGVSCGPIGWRVLGSGARRTYCFVGEAVREAALAACSGEPWAVEVRGPFDAAPFPPDGGGAPPPAGGGGEDCFASRRILGLGPGGEFRDVVAVFTGLRLGPGLSGLDSIADDAIGVCCEHGGHVGGVFFEDKGPCLLSLFGAPVAHGNDLERACRFATDLAGLHPGRTRSALSAGRGYAGLLGSRGRCTYTALGDVVNTACRVMCRAEWGSVMLAGRRGLRSGGGLQMVPRGLLRLKGKDRPVPVARVEPLRRRVSAERGAPLPQRGRWRELERMLAFISEGTHRSAPSILLVTGRRGAGKTAFLDRVCDSLGSGYSVFRCPGGRMGSQDGIMLEPLFRELGLRMPEADAGEDGPGGLGLLRGGPVSASAQAGRAALLREALVRRAGEDLPVIIVDDLQEADPASVRTLRAMAGTGGRLALVVSWREGRGEAGLRPAGSAALLRMHLRPLGRRDASLLIRDVLDRPPDHSLLERVLALSEGNPLFITEYCRLLLAEGLVDTASATARLLPGAAADAPDSIDSVITARLDRLGPELRRLVLAASVIGREFGVEMLEAVSGRRALSVQLERGTELGIWRSAGSGRFRFSHAAFRRCCYGILMGRELRGFHLEAARALERAGACGSFRARELAHHLSMGGEPDSARRLLREAADRAWKAERPAEAACCLESLSELSGGGLAPGTSLLHARSLELCGRPGDAQAVYARMLEGGCPRPAAPLTGLSRLARRAGRTREALDGARKALELAGAEDVAEALEALGAALMAEGEPGAAEGAYRRQLAEAAAGEGGSSGAGRARAGLAAALEAQGRASAAADEAEAAAELLRRQGEEVWLEACLARVGRLRALLGQPDASVRALEEWLGLAREGGRRRSECAASYALADVLFGAGDFRRAADRWGAAADLARSMGDRGCESRSLGRLGACLIRMGSRGSGMRALEAAQRIARETSNVSAVAWALFYMGTVHRQEGRLDEAAASLQQAADILRGEPGACGLSDVMTALADVHMRRGEGKSARRTLREAMGLGGCLRQSKAMERARRRLAELERLRRSGPDLPDDASG